MPHKRRNTFPVSKFLSPCLHPRRVSDRLAAKARLRQPSCHREKKYAPTLSSPVRRSSVSTRLCEYPTSTTLCPFPRQAAFRRAKKKPDQWDSFVGGAYGATWHGPRPTVSRGISGSIPPHSCKPETCCPATRQRDRKYPNRTV